jgi:hypothetical protein
LAIVQHIDSTINHGNGKCSECDEYLGTRYFIWIFADGTTITLCLSCAERIGENMFLDALRVKTGAR